VKYGQNSFRTQAEKIARVAADENLSLRETVLHFERRMLTPFVGSATTVADEIERWFVGAAADGFILHLTVPSEFERFASDVLPLLRERGLFRTEYESDTLRGNLGLRIPENRYTAARTAAAKTPASVVPISAA
jgi:hypothetical protein